MSTNLRSSLREGAYIPRRSLPNLWRLRLLHGVDEWRMRFSCVYFLVQSWRQTPILIYTLLVTQQLLSDSSTVEGVFCCGVR